MHTYTWRVASHRMPHVLRVLSEAAEATRLRRHLRLQALREELRAMPGFPLASRQGDKVVIEEVKPVLSYSSAGVAQAKGQLVRANGEAQAPAILGKSTRDPS